MIREFICMAIFYQPCLHTTYQKGRGGGLRRASSMECVSYPRIFKVVFFLQFWSWSTCWHCHSVVTQREPPYIYHVPFLSYKVQACQLTIVYLGVNIHYVCQPRVSITVLGRGWGSRSVLEGSWNFKGGTLPHTPVNRTPPSQRPILHNLLGLGCNKQKYTPKAWTYVGPVPVQANSMAVCRTCTGYFHGCVLKAYKVGSQYDTRIAPRSVRLRCNS